MTAGNRLQSALASKLREKCTRHHLVVWDDPARHYSDAAEAVTPAGWEFESYSGSWWELRRRVETAFSGSSPPKLVIYVPSPPPRLDPLEEVRQAGGKFKLLLPTLIKEALAGELSATRIADLAAKCSTLTAAEQAAAGSQIDPVLVTRLGAHDPEAALAWLLLEAGEGQPDPDLGSALASLALEHLGFAFDPSWNTEEIRHRLAHHLVVATLAGIASEEVAKQLVASWQPLTDHQQRHVRDLVERASRPGSMTSWGELADRASADLHLADLPWDDRLAGCDVARSMDEICFARSAELLLTDPASAGQLAKGRIDNSRWLIGRDPWATRTLAAFDSVRSIARLHRHLARYRVPDADSLGEVYEWYAEGGWRVDRAHRLMESSRIGLSRPGLDRAFTSARAAYLEWLDRLLIVTNAYAGRSPDTALPAQAEIYRRHVQDQDKVALVIVDAMRLEIGHRLAEVLKGVTATPSVEAAAAGFPTITQVGMANLLPEAIDGLAISRAEAGMVVAVGGKPVRTVADRTNAYRLAAGRVEDHPLSEWLSLGDDVLADRVANSDLVLVRSQEIDAAGEKGMPTFLWPHIDATVSALATLVGRLAAVGIEKVVVTADHGFLALSRPLDTSRVRQVPTGSGHAEHRRAWVGQPATVPDGCTVLCLADLGMQSEDSIVVPDGMTVFGSSGGGFFHGGIGPQEAVVPVITVAPAAGASQPAEYLTAGVEIPGGKIAAEAFSARLTLAGSLFAVDVAVRITATDESGETVARLMPGKSVDEHTGTVRLDPGGDTILTFLITRDLDKGQELFVGVLDASTGRRLAFTQATVGRDLRPEEDW